MNRCVILAIGIACLLAASSVAEEPPGAGSGRPASEANREAGLPDGTIREGTLGNAKLIHDAKVGVAAQMAIIDMAMPSKVAMYVVQDAAGDPGACCWREKWFVTDVKDQIGMIDLLFIEDGSGGATWLVETASKVEGGEIKRTGDGEQAAAMRDMAPDALEAVVRADSERYVATAKKFMELSIAGKVHEMITITSPMTIAMYGLGGIHEKYAKNYLPACKDATVEWDEDFVVMSDETGNIGIELTGKLNGKKPYRIHVRVTREGGRHVVIGFDAKRPVEAEPSPDEARPARRGV